jgi:ABC-2 type transport system permease protein
MNRLFSLRRLMAIITKEAIQMRRDRITFAMMLGVPLMQLVLFGFAINNDPKGLPAALVTTSQDHYTRAMVSAMENTGYYRFDHVVASAEEADRLIKSGAVSFVVTVPSDFARRVQRGDHPQILIEADATDPSVASGSDLDARDRGGAGAVARAVRRSAGRRAINRGTQCGRAPALQSRRHYPVQHCSGSAGGDPAADDGDDDLDGADAGDGTRDHGEPACHACEPAGDHAGQGAALPGRRRRPGPGGAGGCKNAVRRAVRRPLWLLLVSILIFVLALVLLGYAISTLARTQMQAMQLTFFFFLPSLLLSGFMFPFRGMPEWAQCAWRGTSR